MLISRAFGQTVTLINPSEPVRDGDDTAWLPGPPRETESAADLWQLGTEQLVFGASGEVVADWEGIFPTGAPVTMHTQVRDETGALLRVTGQPEARRSLRTGQPDHIGARLKFISDQQQGATS